MSAYGGGLHVTLVATPDAQLGPLSGIFETLTAFPLLRRFEPGVPDRPFEVEIASTGMDRIRGASGLTLAAHRGYAEIERTDIPVETIAFQVGYANTAFFRRLFKRSTRMTPGAYRKKFRGPG